MNINWFLTIPGILITGGVLLLIVALIIFVATSSKKNKNSEIENKSLTEANSMVNSAANTDTSNVNSAGVVPENNSIGSVMTAQQGVSADSFTNIANNMEQPIATPMASNDASQQVVGSDVAQVNDNISTPVADTTVPIQEFQSTISDNTVLGSENVVAPVTNNIPTPVADTAVPVQEFQPPVSNNVVSISQDTDTPVTDNISTPITNNNTIVSPEEIKSDLNPLTSNLNGQQENANPSVSIYGGVSPTIPNFNVNESNHQIYGGADPLENTQPVSLSDINNAVNSAEPIVPKSPVEEIPQAEVLTNNENSVSTTTEAPMVMPIQGDTPVVSSSESIDNPINPVQSMSESNVEAPNVAPTITEPTVNVLDTPQVQPIQDTSEVNSAIPVVSSNNM